MLEREDPVNWSTLRYLRPGVGSPKHYRDILVSPRKDTEALLLGRLVHCLVYEPGKVDRRYARMPRFHGGMNDDTACERGYDGGKQSKAAWEADVADRGLTVVPAEIYERAEAMKT